MARILSFIKNWRRVDQLIKELSQLNSAVEDTGEHMPIYRHKNYLWNLLDCSIICGIIFCIYWLAHGFYETHQIVGSLLEGYFGAVILMSIGVPPGIVLYFPLRGPAGMVVNGRPFKYIPSTESGIKSLEQDLDYYRVAIARFAQQEKNYHSLTRQFEQLNKQLSTVDPWSQIKIERKGNHFIVQHKLQYELRIDDAESCQEIIEAIKGLYHLD